LDNALKLGKAGLEKVRSEGGWGLEQKKGISTGNGLGNRNGCAAASKLRSVCETQAWLGTSDGEGSKKPRSVGFGHLSVQHLAANLTG